MPNPDKVVSLRFKKILAWLFGPKRGVLAREEMVRKLEPIVKAAEAHYENPDRLDGAEPETILEGLIHHAETALSQVQFDEAEWPRPADVVAGALRMRLRIVLERREEARSARSAQ